VAAAVDSGAAAAAAAEVTAAAAEAMDAISSGSSFFSAAVAAAVDSAANTCRKNRSTKHKDCGPDIPGRSFSFIRILQQGGKRIITAPDSYPVPVRPADFLHFLRVRNFFPVFSLRTRRQFHILHCHL
jgi:hypothetical protein